MYKYEYRRRSICLSEYDYSKTGGYFVTICVQNKQWPFGRIENDQMQLSAAGKMVDKWWRKIPAKFSGIELGEYIIMPDHFHGIIHIVGADPCVCPQINRQGGNIGNGAHGRKEKGGHAGPPLREINFTVSKIIQWFKTMTTNEYIRNVKTKGWEPFYDRLWQRNYYEHIIRTDRELARLEDYIKCNPMMADK